MKKVSFSLLIAALAMMAVLAVAQEAEKPAAKAGFEYVGANACKVCHKDVYAAWEQTPHAKAFTVLSAEEQKKPECVTCHVTGTTAKGELIEGVSCEACHGPGSAYKSPKIMAKKWKDDPATYKKVAIEAGLVYSTAENCQRCHKQEGNPNFKPFDFEKSKGLVHPVAATTGAGK